MDKRVLENYKQIANFRFKTILDHFDFNIECFKNNNSFEGKNPQTENKKNQIQTPFILK